MVSRVSGGGSPRTGQKGIWRGVVLSQPKFMCRHEYGSWANLLLPFLVFESLPFALNLSQLNVNVVVCGRVRARQNYVAVIMCLT